MPILEVDVIEDMGAAQTVLDPVRARVLSQLAEPGSATTVAEAIGQSRQKVNYHMRKLEDHGLLSLVEERPRRGLTERVMQASARSYALSPAVLGESATEPDSTDRLSTQYLIAVAARLVGEVGRLARMARKAGRPLAVLTIDTEIRFASAADRAAFTAEISAAVTDLARRYHDESAPGGRRHRLIVAAHPSLPQSRETRSRAAKTKSKNPKNQDKKNQNKKNQNKKKRNP